MPSSTMDICMGIPVVSDPPSPSLSSDPCVSVDVSRSPRDVCALVFFSPPSAPFIRALALGCAYPVWPQPSTTRQRKPQCQLMACLHHRHSIHLLVQPELIVVCFCNKTIHQDTSEAGAAVEMDIGVPPPPSASFFWRVPESPGGSPSLRRRSLAERRGCKAPLAFSLERVARRASASNAEDTRTDHITEAQRDMLFSSATG